MEDIVERLRFAADDTDAVENASVAYLLEDAADEIERLRLTDEERLAVERAAITLEIREASKGSHQAGSGALVLRRLLERLG